MTGLGWSLWTSLLALAVLVTLVDRTTFLRATAVVAVATLFILLYILRVARTVQWVLLLDDRRLTIARVPPVDVGAVTSLDVSEGVKLDVIGDRRALRVDAAVALVTNGRRARWSPGIRPAHAISQLAAFLRANHVSVTLPPDTPVGWAPPNYPIP